MTWKATDNPCCRAACTSASYGAHLAAAYAFGFAASNLGLCVDPGSGAIKYHETFTRTVRAPSARASGSDVAGAVKNDVSWMIETCVVEADAGPAALSQSVARTASTSAPVSRPRSFVGLVSGVCIDGLLSLVGLQMAISR